MADALKQIRDGDDPVDTTVAFYDAAPEEYAAQTLGRDVSSLYRPFLEQVSPGGLILDAGCGAGRDIREFLARGYRVEAFDASRGLARMAEEHTGIDVEVARFEDWEGRADRFDGIWCFASLLHVAREDLPGVLARLVASLRAGSPLFASFKWGENDVIDGHGRSYTNLTERSARSLFGNVAELANPMIWTDEGPTALDDRTRWIYVLARRS